MSCKVHRNSVVKSLDPCSLIFQTLSQPTVLKMKSNSTSIPVAERRAGSYADVCMKLLVFNSLKASFSRLFRNLRYFSNRMFLSAADDWGGTLTTGGGTSICMSALALEEELLVEWPNPERMSLSLNLFNILHKVNRQQNSWNGLGNKMPVVSRPEVSRPRVSRSWLLNEFYNQNFDRTSTLNLFSVFLQNFGNTSILNLSYSS